MMYIWNSENAFDRSPGQVTGDQEECGTNMSMSTPGITTGHVDDFQIHGAALCSAVLPGVKGHEVTKRESSTTR